eukprot:SAG31_NODE_2286_length_6006_cov_4.245810_3_plen_44_part_00
MYRRPRARGAAPGLAELALAVARAVEMVCIRATVCAPRMHPVL